MNEFRRREEQLNQSNWLEGQLHQMRRNEEQLDQIRRKGDQVDQFRKNEEQLNHIRRKEEQVDDIEQRILLAEKSVDSSDDPLNSSNTPSSSSPAQPRVAGASHSSGSPSLFYNPLSMPYKAVQSSSYSPPQPSESPPHSSYIPVRPSYTSPQPSYSPPRPPYSSLSSPYRLQPPYNPLCPPYLHPYLQHPSKRNSVIVHQQRAAPYPRWREETGHQRIKEEPVLQEEAPDSRTFPKHYAGFPGGMPPDRAWFTNMQRLQTSFAFQMLEAERHRRDRGLPSSNLQLLDQLARGRGEGGPEVKEFLPPSQGAIALVDSFLKKVESPIPRPHAPSTAPQGDTVSSSTSALPLLEQGERVKRGRPRKHAPKVPLPPLYVFIRNLLHSPAYNPSTVAWVDEESGCFKVTSTSEFARTWGRMKVNRSEEMNYEKMSRAMRYHYGSEKSGRKGHLAMVKEKRLFYR